MNILNLGWHSFRLVDGGVSLLFDPLTLADNGGKVPRTQNDIIVLSQGEEDDYGKSDGFVIANPGEYEVKDVFVYGFPSTIAGKKTTIYLVEMEGLKILHLGGAGADFKFSDELLERFADVDILLLPVGGEDFWGPKKALEIVNQLEPRITIPMGYQDKDLKVKALPLADFTKEIGGNFETGDKLKVARKDLPEDTNKFFVIEKA